MQKLGIQIGATAAAFGLTLIARKALEAGYRKRTGHEPPDPQDLRDPIWPALGWAMTSAALSAVIQAAIQRKAARVQATAIGAQPAPPAHTETRTAHKE